MFAQLLRDPRRTPEGIRRLDGKFDVMEARMSRDCRWLVGIQITNVVAIIVALISRG